MANFLGKYGEKDEVNYATPSHPHKLGRLRQRQWSANGTVFRQGTGVRDTV